VSIRGDYLSVAITLGEQLSLGLKPIGFGVTRQCESAASIGNEIRAQTNLFVRWRWYSRLWRDGTLCSLRSRNLFITHPPASFGLLLRGAAETLYRGSLLRSVRQLLVTFDFCFGQFCSFSAQIDWC